MTLLLLAILGVGASCAATSRAKSKQGVLCVWPDPITFTTADDDWKVCFDIDHQTSTGYQPLCTTVRDLRRMIASRRLGN